ncbi:MAG: hypothetical protein ACOC2N_05780 [Spirochaetota bacterium]
MKNVIALFTDASDAEKAIKALSDNGLDTSKARIHSSQTIEQSTNVRAFPGANAAVSGGSTPAASGAGAAAPGGGAFLADDNVESYLSHIGIDGNELSFYKHGIIEGGYLVMIAVENDQVDLARKTLKEAGGRAAQTE